MTARLDMDKTVKWELSRIVSKKKSSKGSFSQLNKSIRFNDKISRIRCSQTL